MNTIFHQIKPGLILVVLAVILSSIMLVITFSPSHDMSVLTQTADANQAHSSSYCSSLCAGRKAEARIRRSYACHHLNYICLINVVPLDWNNGNWGWSAPVGQRCRYITWVNGMRIYFACHTAASGGQISKRDGGWHGFWFRVK